MKGSTESGRVFGPAKRVERHWANVLGAQPIRAVAARALHRALGRSTTDRAAEVRRHGITVFRDFLPDDAFAATVREADELVGRGTEEVHVSGPTTVRFFPLQGIDEATFPNLVAWRQDRRVLDLIGDLEGEPVPWFKGLPRVEDNTYSDVPGHDVQNDLHLDIVFSAYKTWLYLTDVEAEHGPFVYVPGSHRLDLHRLRREYADSVRTPVPDDASRRVLDDELEHRGLERQVMTVPRNTLVLANVSGYHARAVAAAGHGRRALHQSFRLDPFRRRSVRRILRRA